MQQPSRYAYAGQLDDPRVVHASNNNNIALGETILQELNRDGLVENRFGAQTGAQLLDQTISLVSDDNTVQGELIDVQMEEQKQPIQRMPLLIPAEVMSSLNIEAPEFNLVQPIPEIESQAVVQNENLESL